jgi:hypothetical protein
MLARAGVILPNLDDRVSSKKAKVTGWTFYIHDSLYAMLRTKAIDRGETASECLTWIVEGYFKLRKKEPGESAEAAA